MTENTETPIQCLAGCCPDGCCADETERTIFESSNVVRMTDHIARLKDAGKMARGFRFTYFAEKAAVIDLAAHRARHNATIACW